MIEYIRQFYRPHPVEQVSPEKREVLENFQMRALRRMLCPTLSNAFSQDLNGQPIAVRQNEKEYGKTNDARRALSGLLAECGFDVASLANSELRPEEFFNQERRVLRYCWNEASVWERSGQYFLAVDFCLANLFSPENLNASGLFGNRSEAVSQKMMAFFEAHTGTLDMPAVALMPLDLRELDKKQVKKVKKRAVKFGRHKRKALKQKHYGKFNAIFDQAFTVFEQSDRGLDLVPGWISDRWVMFQKPDKVITSLTALGDKAIAISRSGMGAEHTAGWKITEGKKITPFDLAKQKALFDDLIGCWFDCHIFEMHSMGAHAGVYLRHFLNQRLRWHDELLEKRYWYEQYKQESETGDFAEYLAEVRGLEERRNQWYQAYRQLPENEKKLPFFSMIWDKPALFRANVFTDFWPLKALFAAEGQPVDLRGWEEALRLLNRFPEQMRQLLEWPLTLAVTKWHLLQDTKWPVILIHVVNAITEVEIAAAQARGLWDFSKRQQLDVLESLTSDSGSVPIITLVADDDYLVGQEQLHEILGVSQDDIKAITHSDPHMTVSSGVLVEAAKFGLSTLPMLFVRLLGDHYADKPDLIPDFIRFCRHLKRYQLVTRGERNTFGVARGYLVKNPWALVVHSLIEKLPFRLEAQFAEKWAAFWFQAGGEENWANGIKSRLENLFRETQAGTPAVKSGYQALFANSLMPMPNTLKDLIGQFYQAGYFLLSRKTDNDKKP
ncbi:hypothetical protein KKD62_02830 [Patescibacteria group bacterium]|nr:hypothetical protein [Patescibacteria group bacterium]MBU1931835.1 hypothetical protein [Patescibacteria group bacterium]